MSIYFVQTARALYKALYRALLIINILSLFMCLCCAHACTVAGAVELVCCNHYCRSFFMFSIGALYAFGGASWLLVLALVVAVSNYSYSAYISYKQLFLGICLQIPVVSGWCAWHKYDILYGVPAGGQIGQLLSMHVLKYCNPALQELLPEILISLLYISFALLFPWHIIIYFCKYCKIYTRIIIPIQSKSKKTISLRRDEFIVWAQEKCG